MGSGMDRDAMIEKFGGMNLEELRGWAWVMVLAVVGLKAVLAPGWTAGKVLEFGWLFLGWAAFIVAAVFIVLPLATFLLYISVSGLRRRMGRDG